jgi:S-DNA-T family DNA segregation ATPase FtsK/SpoIIIE
VNVITGLIKTNFPTRIAFRVVGRVDSQTILDTTGAENLIGRGDMLYYAGVEMERVQCALVSMAEINKITDYIGAQTGYKQCYSTPYYLPVPESQDGETSGGTIDMQNIDPMFEEAARMVVTSQKGSTSDLQRRLGMGYARAGRVMDQLEAAGIVGPQDGAKPRKVLVADIQELEELMASFLN